MARTAGRWQLPVGNGAARRSAIAPGEVEMLCDNCKERDGIVQLTQVKNGTVVQVRLCEKCAAEQGVETSVATPTNKPLGDFLQAVQQQSLTMPGDQGACDFCGATTRDFRASGRLGCARCYGAFERSLRELLRRLHGTPRHTGRRYSPPAPELLEQASLVGQLKERLRRAVDSEQFELAAELRDRLRTYE
jgi:protein arginine kinase activator